MESQPRIMISGETAGTGASTTAKLLADNLNLPTISGGRYFRGLANRFDRHLHDNNHLSLAENYQNFFSAYDKAYRTSGLDGVNRLVGDGYGEGAKGDVLAQFETAIKESSRKTREIHKVWDYTVEQNTMKDALSKPGFIWEGKIAILALELDQMQEVIPQNEYTNSPYLNILLKIDPKVAAQRVGQREARSVGVKEIVERKKRDYERYGDLYTIHRRKVSHKNLAKHADIVINTEMLSPSEVATEALTGYLRKLSIVGATEPKFSQPIINQITTALKSF